METVVVEMCSEIETPTSCMKQIILRVASSEYYLVIRLCVCTVHASIIIRPYRQTYLLPVGALVIFWNLGQSENVTDVLFCTCACLAGDCC